MDTELLGVDGWSADKVRRALGAAVEAVREQEEALNRMNVFPIPDHDTGSNLCLTLRSSLAGLDRDEPSADRVLGQFSRSALIHARGNSGVIVAEILRGFAEAAEAKEVLLPETIVEALSLAAEYAYQAVANPVEGTILSAVRAAAEAVAVEKAMSSTIPRLWAVAASAAHQATNAGPQFLPILAEHNVVDAAALGFSYFLQGLAGLSEELPSVRPQYGYEVQFLLMTDVERSVVQHGLTELGNSLVVSGGKGLYRVHIHTPSPGQVLEVAREFGAMEQVTVDDLDGPGAHGQQEAR